MLLASMVSNLRRGMVLLEPTPIDVNSLIEPESEYVDVTIPESINNRNGTEQTTIAIIDPEGEQATLTPSSFWTEQIQLNASQDGMNESVDNLQDRVNQYYTVGDGEAYFRSSSNETTDNLPPWDVEQEVIPEAVQETVQPEIDPDLPTIDDIKGLVNYIVKEDRGENTDRLKDVLVGKMVHATHLPKICPRQVAIMRSIGVTEPSATYEDFIDSNTQLIWATGRAFEKHLRDQLIASPKIDNDALIGEFVCDCGKSKNIQNYDETREIVGNIEECEVCGTPALNYKELGIFVKNKNTVLSPDLPYFNKQRQIVVVEMKSIKGEKFKKLRDAQKPHIQQVLMYHQAGEMNGYNMAPYVNVMYASKGWVNPKNELPYKQFRIPVEEEKAVIASNAKLFDLGEVIGAIDKDGKVDSKYDHGDGYPSPVTDCESMGCSRARSCQVNSICFTLRNEE